MSFYDASKVGSTAPVQQQQSLGAVEKAPPTETPSVQTASKEQAQKPIDPSKATQDFGKNLLFNLKFGGGAFLSFTGAAGALLTSPLIAVGYGVGYGVGALLQRAGVSPEAKRYGETGGMIIGSLGALAVLKLGLLIIDSAIKMKNEKPVDNTQVKEKPLDLSKMKDEKIEKLTPDQIKNLPESEVKKLRDHPHLDHFSKAQLQSLDVTKLDSKELNLFLSSGGSRRLSLEQVNQLLGTQTSQIIEGKQGDHPLKGKISEYGLERLRGELISPYRT